MEGLFLAGTRPSHFSVSFRFLQMTTLEPGSRVSRSCFVDSSPSASRLFIGHCVFASTELMKTENRNERPVSESTSMSRRITISIESKLGVDVVSLGETEDWAHSDLIRVRDTMARLVSVEKRRRVGIDMSHARTLPCGFFGMLCDLYESGVDIRLHAPQPCVQRMVWFRQFFEETGTDVFRFSKEQRKQLLLPDWNNRLMAEPVDDSECIPATVP